MFLNYKQIPQNSQSKQKGSMLVMALFAIIVLSLLGLTVTRLLSSTTNSVVYEVLGQQALNAARTGMECKISEQFPISGAVNCSDPDSKDLSGIPGLNNCSYTTSLDNFTVVDGGKSFNYSKFSSTGQCSGGLVIVSRTIYVDAKVEL
ncbi:pilus assembly PilX N-terminal domain-containing protein [Paraglaciecola sp. 2405UD69-4]|uniref:pilus assembly PilX N-terminal domain-containing protein n=1 Tax=Paraglaciecola sp. 2405UD69-4 TaxID=3391836 RepID=UPI0039C951E5